MAANNSHGGRRRPRSTGAGPSGTTADEVGSDREGAGGSAETTPSDTAATSPLGNMTARVATGYERGGGNARPTGVVSATGVVPPSEQDGRRLGQQEHGEVA